ncbi:MAG: ATP-dependent helicase UvrD/PcrA [Acidimicrobiaceae bacterium]|nr:ATP-dependent helicase UvrD/PcrA [Acidimicrobiaceae bacterium]MDQ1415840.1 ATP-dependent helicase UvrD/PcrA [Acidimicrobiaceae bacterium]
MTESGAPATRLAGPGPPSTAPPPVPVRPSLLEGLNPVQLAAVTHPGGPLLVVAGAGSGKTRVLTRRIAWLVKEQHVSPFEILAITFTNKAADEMKHRVASLVGPVAERMWVSTFHSACVRILRRDAHRLGYKSSFTIYDEADANRLVGYVLRDLNMDPKKLPPRAVHGLISAAKNDLIDFETYAGQARTIYDRRIAEVYREYQRRLLNASAMDFDDLLLVTVNLLQASEDVRRYYQQRFRHILVDEYQDTNRAQNELVLMLSQGHRNICVVGDTDQSVYRWRGADIRNILQFEEAFPDAKVVVLEQNYRSTQLILDAANAVIANNAMRKPKSLWTERVGGELITTYHAEDEHDEGRWIATEIGRLHDRYSWGDVAIFYRTNAQSRAVEEELVRRNISYKVVGGTKFYDRREIKDVLAYLKALVNPTDEVSLKRIVNVPKRGIGDTSVDRLEKWARANNQPFDQALRQAEAAGVTGKALGGIRDLVGLLDELRFDAGIAVPTEAAAPLAEQAPPANVIESILARTGYRAELEAEHTIESEGRLDNLDELLGAAAEADDIDQFLEQVSLVADSDEIVDDQSNVLLMTLHTAKGLEFPVVFVIGMEDGVFPHLRSLGDPDELEEERRLAYVGFTRARERLYLSHAWCRNLWGQTQYNPPSRFLREVPASLVSAAAEPRRRPGSGLPFGGREAIVESAIRGGKASPVRGTGAEGLGLRRNDDVVHAKWGEGVVLEVVGEGEKAEATVHFPSVGDKRLNLSLAPLKRA